MKILVVGDSFVPVPVFQLGLGALQGAHQLQYVQLDESQQLVPSTASELSIREYLGTPAQLVSRIKDADVLVVHGAPVTDEVLAAASRLRLICCARGGPVNVDVAAASARQVPVVITPGKNAESVADQTLAFMIMLARGFPKAQRFLLDGGTLGESAFEGARFLGHDLVGHVLGLVGFGNVGRAGVEVRLRVAARESDRGNGKLLWRSPVCSHEARLVLPQHSSRIARRRGGAGCRPRLRSSRGCGP